MIPNSEARKEMYRQIVRIRRFELALQKAYMEGKTPVFNIAAGPLPGELHLSCGQEPVAVGICAHLRKSDALCGPHRQHHLAVAKGLDLKKMAAEIFGKEAGLGHGRGGHMHLFDKHNRFGSSGTIGGGMPTAAGFALAFQRQGSDDVAVSVFGEGTTNQGAFHETLNLAALWKLPMVFVSEDNAWAVSVHKRVSTPVKDNSVRAAAYGIPGAQVLNNDPDKVYDVCGEAIARARKGGGPTLIEVQTDRLMGHFEGDPQLYRSKEELEEVKRRDCFVTYRQRLIDDGVLTEADALQMVEAATAEIGEAVAYARACPYPKPESALQHVFAE
jgi:pyruvate dehydrogenase E1 component alpha subunit